jgi:choline dehydrogenase-like flavoprotein
MNEPDKPGIVEGQTLQADLNVSADVCIIGSGAGGAVTADRLARAGLRVIVLDEGGYFTHHRFRMREVDAYPHLYQEGAQRATKDLGITILQGKALGGTTVINWTTCFRTPKRVVDHWAAHHQVTGVTHESLLPHWDAIEERLSISEVPETHVNRNNRILEKGCKKLGYPVEAMHRNVRNCISSGYCGVGCPVDAKQSMAVTYVPDAVAAGATFFSRCKVERLTMKNGEVVGLDAHFLDATGRRPTGVKIDVRAKHFIVAGGAINSPALLLRSGVPDPHQRLGLRTTLHLASGVLGVYKEKVAPYYGAPQSRASHQFHDRGDKPGFLIEAAPYHPVFAGILSHGLGPEKGELMKLVPYVSVTAAITGDGLHPDLPGGRVTVDRDGFPMVDYPLNQAAWENYRFMLKELARIQLAAGAEYVYSPHDPIVKIQDEGELKKLDEAPYKTGSMVAISFHQMGGCAMGGDPKTSVVRSEDLRHHQISNLHIVDGSVFPTSVTVNPSVSIYGLAHLMGTRLAEKWG